MTRSEHGATTTAELGWEAAGRSALSHGGKALLPFLGHGGTPIMNTNNTSTISCCECCKDIPLDAALTPEGSEYVVHFCGLECYQRFMSRADKRAASEPDHPCTQKVSTRQDG
nr:Urf-2 protein [Pseudomonas sp.]